MVEQPQGRQTAQREPFDGLNFDADIVEAVDSSCSECLCSCSKHCTIFRKLEEFPIKVYL